MSKFLTRIRAEKCGFDASGRQLWELLEPLAYHSDEFGLVVVPEGFRTNYASVPRLPVVFLVAGDRAHEEACVHDYEYTVRRRTREQADRQFLESLQAEKPIERDAENRTPAWLAKAMYQAVRFGGQGAWDADSTVVQPVEIATEIEAP